MNDFNFTAPMGLVNTSGNPHAISCNCFSNI